MQQKQMRLHVWIRSLLLACHVTVVGMNDQVNHRITSGWRTWTDIMQRDEIVTSQTSFPEDYSVTFPPINNTENPDPSNIGRDSDIWPYMAVIVSIMAAIISISNFIMILCYLLKSRVRLVLRVFVFNLCLVDFQNGCIALPLSVVYPRGTASQQWMKTVSGPACVFITFWPTSLVITAYLSIVLVTVERFIAILFPMHFRKITSLKHCVIVVIFIWIYSILFSFAPAFAIHQPSTHDDEDYIVGCNGLYVYSEEYVDFFLYGILCVPLIFVLVMYMIMYYIARKHLKAIAAVTLPDPMRTQKDKRVLHNSKAAKTTCIMTLIFVICWLPFLIIMLLSDLCNFDTCPDFTDETALRYGMIATSCMAFLNSALNPWIYGFRNPVIQMELRAIFCPKKRSPVVSIIGATSTGQAYYYPITRFTSSKQKRSI